jgi:1-acyl-sn-glycerol-3-phosphate acyltransferase
MIATIRAGFALTVISLSLATLCPIQHLLLKAGSRSLAIPRFLHRVIVRGLGLRVTIHGAIARERPLMIVSNHVSWMDIPVIGSIDGVCFVAKQEMSGWPALGWMARLERTVFVERDRRHRSGEQVSELARRVAEGDPMVLFAEGSTSDGNMIMPFKSTLLGAATAAIREGVAETVHVQPVAITYTRVQGIPMGRQHRALAAWIGDTDLFPHLMAILREGAIDVDVHFGEPLAFTAASDRKAANREIESRVRSMVSSALRDTRPLVRAR